MPKRKETDFKIQDILTFKVIRPRSLLRDLISNPETNFQCFRTGTDSKPVNHPDRPDLTVTIGDFQPDLGGALIVDGKYFIKDDFIFFREKYKIATWETEITGFESSGNDEANSIRIRIRCNPFGLIFASGLIEFFLRFALLRKGYALLHSFGIAKNGRGYLFPARSGVGKTISSTYFLDEGYQTLGDNFVLVRDGKMFAYPTPMNIFTYNLTPPLAKRCGMGLRIALGLKWILYKSTLGYAKFLTPVQIHKVFPGSIAASHPIDAVILMLTGDNVKLSPIADGSDIIPTLCAINKFETTLYLKMIASYALHHPGSRLAGHWRELGECLTSSLSGLPCHRLEVPRRYYTDTFSRIKAIVEGFS